ncbi:MAG TPA: MMPL family transporter, partial [Acidimicrobiales bacterium]
MSQETSTDPEAGTGPRQSAFARFGLWCHDRRRIVAAFWVLLLIVGNMASGAMGDAFRDEFNLDAESTDAFDVLDERFGGQGTGLTGTIVFEAQQGVDDPEVEAAMQAIFDDVATVPDVVQVESPYDEGGEQLIASEGPEAGKIAYAKVELSDEIDLSEAQEIRDRISDQVPDIEGLRVELGGVIFGEGEPPSSEALGLAFAIVILIVAFGSVLAMGLPVGVALAGIGIGVSIITIMSNVVTLPELATFLGIMIGLGVGIDYALLIVTRMREQLHAGHTVRESVGIAMDTAGRAVLFAGLTVVISMLGMLVIGITFITGLAVGAALVVAVTIAASLTFLPALLGFTGEKIERTRWRGLIAALLVAVGLVGAGLSIDPLLVGIPLAVVVLLAGLVLAPLKKEVKRRPPKARQATLAYRWSRVIQHRPWFFTIVGAVILLVLSIPFLQLRLGVADESNYAEDTTTRQAYDLLVTGFGEGFNGPLLLVAELPEGADPADLGSVTEVVDEDPDVVFVSPPVLNDPDDPTAVLWQVVPNSGPQSEETTALVERLRSDVLPPVAESTGVEVMVSGTVAVNADFSDYLSSRMPYFLGAVLLLSFLLLMVVFRSLLVPLKAVIMNLLSIGAAYGVVVALFQWGWLSDITGVQPAPIEPWAPMMLFAIVFGLSMDYEVFLLSRMREAWDRTHDNREAVAAGLERSGQIVTSA